MDFEEAKSILIHFNKWRRDRHIPNAYEMPNPTMIGFAIDFAITAITILETLLNIIEKYSKPDVKRTHPHKTYKKHRQHLCRGSKVHFRSNKR